MLKGLIFDFDGLILDTEMPAYQAWQEVYHQYGKILPLNKWLNCIGTSPDKFDAFDYLQGLVNVPLPREQILAARHTVEMDLISKNSARPGVLDLLNAAKERGLKLAVASSSPRSWIDQHLTHLGLRDRFEQIYSAEDVERVKPAPDLFNAALEGLNLSSDMAVVFEDSLNGIQAARMAGIYCVAVPNEITCHMDLSLANQVARSLEEISLDSLDEAMKIRI